MIALVTDSTAGLPPELAAELGARVVPLHVLLDGESFVEGVDIGPDEVAAALREGRRVSTSKPSAGAFLDVYEEAVAAGAEQIVSVHLSSAMSGTIASARVAADEVPVPVTVVDSRSLGMALGYAVASASEAVASGRSALATAASARERAEAASTVFYVDTLEYLRRGGRIGRASALVGSALAIKPLLQLSEGEVGPLERVRTSSKALARLEERTVEAAEAAADNPLGLDIAVQHVDAGERAEALRDRLRERCADAHEVRLVGLGAVVAAHAGPGAIGTVVSPRVRTTPPVIGAAAV
ncbi:DegV family protein with EDD domain [Barrientosiimonas humi]|uniref:DegV family protein with EDD domain n=1 Tax=Barrientosiimonas humi TaxID=999931 RepID=A0A542XA64_9MICO|nr:DegV family protein [Barrientosiimonas humi]TQL32742.1 DegV family protein with EDD domain [Barrientosiimonas humi]CAG7572733.1 DegV domain-containing protein [Barrientosiimonas humi]